MIFVEIIDHSDHSGHSDHIQVTLPSHFSQPWCWRPLYSVFLRPHGFDGGGVRSNQGLLPQCAPQISRCRRQNHSKPFSLLGCHMLPLSHCQHLPDSALSLFVSVRYETFQWRLFEFGDEVHSRQLTYLLKSNISKKYAQVC